MPKFIVLGWTKNGERKGSPMGLNGPQGGKILSFHCSVRTQVFNDRRTAQRAIDRSKEWYSENAKDFPDSPWDVTRYAIDRLVGV